MAPLITILATRGGVLQRQGRAGGTAACSQHRNSQAESHNVQKYDRFYHHAVNCCTTGRNVVRLRVFGGLQNLTEGENTRTKRDAIPAGISEDQTDNHDGVSMTVYEHLLTAKCDGF